MHEHEPEPEWMCESDHERTTTERADEGGPFKSVPDLA
jgi:hypothetical protein